MDRKKKKQAAIKSVVKVEQLRKAMKQRFLDRTKKIITLVGGEDLYDYFTDIYLEKLFEIRYKMLKAIPAPGSSITKSRVIQFNKLLYELMEGVEVTFPNGNSIPISWYLEEGMTLASSINMFETDFDPKMKEVKECFSFCSRDGEFHNDLQDALIGIVSDTCLMLNDYNDHVYMADLDESPCFAEFNMGNEIIIDSFKPKKETIETRKGMRNAIRLGYFSEDFEWEHVNVKPSLLGFNTISLDIPLEIYITTHAFDRLQERINITPGIMHRILVLIFIQSEIPHRWKGDASHVEFRVSDEKVGYLVLKMDAGKLVIHTFLFLTNNDTFEGEKLGRLLSVVKEDKKYLEIDTLPAFNAYHIDKNEKLSKLFKEAGCGSLLKLGHLQEFTANQIADKDPESILHYLADAPYFRRQASQLD
ncbi:hypothetical protein [Pedobacter nyackensis]|uniref:Uncharacterized protein n=1 Tax=Pedobacter nyackensis TaxID=475255 RepID=A0A1W2EZI1_9SPHI|nr:hypothetical protein [Pedobacter nyackensis]SMD15099.1 hypothetical protein SAMN04488101_11816 [Pedobacter nyackensis]